jgi:hypothetical protein
MAHRINLGPGDEYTPRAFQLWLSDDDRRIPLVVVGDGSLGSIRFALTERTLLDPCQRSEAAPEAPAPSAIPTVANEAADASISGANGVPLAPVLEEAEPASEAAAPGGPVSE